MIGQIFAEGDRPPIPRRELWHRLQEAGYAFAEENYSWKSGLDACNRILDVADETWIARELPGRVEVTAVVDGCHQFGGDDRGRRPAAWRQMATIRHRASQSDV
jgi:hypothetical protein